MDLPRSFRSGKWWAIGVAAGFLAAGFLYLNFARADDVDRLVGEIGGVREMAQRAAEKSSAVEAAHLTENERMSRIEVHAEHADERTGRIEATVNDLYKFTTGHEHKR